MSLVLNDEQLFDERECDIWTMAERAIEMSKELRQPLTEELKTPGSYQGAGTTL